MAQPMAFITDSKAHEIAHKARTHLETVKAEAKSQAARIGALAAAGGVGFGVSFVNTHLGGTQTNPYLVAGKVPLDLLAAGAGAFALIACRKATHLPYIAGAAAGSMALVGARYGATLQPQISQQLSSLTGGATNTASTPAMATTTSGRPRLVGIGSGGHGMQARHGRPHGAYGTAPNPYVTAATGR
jgi:hypothetical protein